MLKAGPSSAASTFVRRLALSVLAAAGAASLIHAQIPGRNVNMVSGDKWPDGDPYLQRQNEPSLAASTRNPLHLLGGSNDYRSVDLPGVPGSNETGDAWLGLYKSFDGGQRWKSTLLPGYPQDESPIGMASPLKGYQAAADPVVRPGTSGLFYYSGIVFDRAVGGKSRLFVARFIDDNNKEAGDPIHYLGASAVASDSGSTGGFIDKPWMAVDIPRSGSKTCLISTPNPRGGSLNQQIPGGTVYLAYSVIRTTTNPTTNEQTITGTIMFTRSIDCGVTWDAPIAVSGPSTAVNQGATLAVDPASGAVQIAWRKLGLGTEPDQIITTRATYGSVQFATPSVLRQFYVGREFGQLMKSLVTNRQKKSSVTTDTASAASEEIQPFDQGTLVDRFRTNAYPTMAIDGGGRVYLAWSERGFRGTSMPDEASIVMTTAVGGTNWAQPSKVDLHLGPGHQFMPSLAFAGGKLMLVFYDLRQDVSGVFTKFVDETTARAVAQRRHTLDLRAAQADAAAVPAFAPSVKISEYLIGSRPNSRVIEPLQFNPPNLPLFQLGTVPFIGDYVDVAPAPMFVQNDNGTWFFNVAPTTAPVFHTAWTDNRDVKPPQDGNWTNYTPPSGSQVNSVFDPAQTVAPCAPGQAGMRNQNVYTARLTAGLMAGSPGNSKPLNPDFPRAFVVFAQNTTASLKWFRMTITSQPAGGWASFSQFDNVAPVTTIDVAVPSRSTVSKSVFATSSNPDAKVPVAVQEIPSAGGQLTPGGLAATVVLNPDISNPDISNPDISNPDISNPDISNTEVYNPDISNPDISNPDISNPDISNPDISNPDISNTVILNPDISNPDISNPDISNPDISNPDISNPDISNPDISNGSLTDYTWTVTNKGNTTAAYDVNMFQTTVVPNGIKTQVVIHRTYTTPVSDGCTLKYQTQTVLVANVVNPQLLTGDAADLSLFLEPGGNARITLRVIDPIPTDGVTFDPTSGATAVTPTVTSTAVNTTDLGTPAPIPPSSTPPTSSTATTSLSVTSQPSNATIASSLGSVQVQVVRTLNNATTPLANASVSAGILVNPSGGHLDGQTTVTTDANGVATFSGLTIDRAGQNYQLLFTAAAAGAVPVTSALFSVTAAGADPTQNIFVVTTTADSGFGSLRDAIQKANSTANGTGGPDVITFGFHLPGTYTISLASMLPPITAPVIIDGTTQAGYDALTGTPSIHVSGTGANQFQGIVVTAGASNSVIRGLSLTGFGTPTVQDTTAAIQTSASGVRIEGNWIGIAPNGISAGNKVGVWITGGNPTIGGTLGTGTRNVISSNQEGIFASGGSAASILGNFIGTSPDGLAPRPNTNLGINVQPGINNYVIGGPVGSGYFSASSPANLISGNLGGGIALQDGGTGGPANTQILGNVIGLAKDGSDLGNNASGILVQNASGTQIGAPGAGNVISGNGSVSPFTPGRGIIIANGPTPAVPAVLPVIRANRIGTDLTGNLAVPNAFEGILLAAPATVGGLLAGAGNVIAGNGYEPGANGTGILLLPEAAGSVIQGNRIGLNVLGAALGNGYSGITIAGTNGVTIGNGPNANGRNIISGNPQRGIQIQPNGATQAANITVVGNWIGTDAAGNAGAVGNGDWGIVAEGTGIAIGGDGGGDENRIAGNGIRLGAGVTGGIAVIGAASSVKIWSNRIHDNNGLGIDLGADGTTANDTGDSDTGPNLLQNAPEIGGAVNASSGEGYIRVRLNSAAGGYRIEVFTNTACDASGRGEGQQLLISANRSVPSGGDLEDVIVLPAAAALLAPGQILTATATDAAGNTSEFSACSTVTSTNAFYWNPVFGGNGHFYEYVTTPLGWNAAASAAAGRSLLGRVGHLGVITSVEENNFITALRANMGLGDMRAWIGLSDPSGANAWEWISEEPFGFTHWDASNPLDLEPNNIGTERWVEIFASGFWNNNVENFSPNQGYIVEYQFPLSF
jgi:hypothetical protein